MGEPGELRFGATLAEAAQLWWRNLPSLGVITAVLVAPLALLELTYHEQEITSSLAVGLGFVAAGLVLAAACEAFGAGLADHVLYADRVGRARMPWWRHAAGLPLATLFGLAVVVGLAVALGAVLLLLPGLAGYAWLSVAAPAASFERLGLLRALRRSVRLVRGRFWRVAALTSVTFVPVVVADQIGATVRAWHAPVWLSILVEAVCEAIVIGLTATVVVVIYHQLRSVARSTTS